jgi:gas vesicle protein GvpL/GvpF
MSIYLYCLTDESPRDISHIKGVEGARPDFVRHGTITAIYSETSAARVAVTRENVMAHERVVRHLLARTTPLPFRFGTLVSPVALGDYIKRERADLEALFARVGGAVEMNVKIIWDRDEAKAAACVEEESQKERLEPVGPGRAFLLAKQRRLATDGAAKQRADRIAATLAEELEGVVRDTIIRLRPSENLIFAAAHLVERVRLEEYRERLGRARRQSNDLHFLTSGAWPPYSFTRLRS